MEAEFVDWLHKHLPPHPAVRIGIGDDAAWLGLEGTAGVVVSTDMLTEGVDFRLNEVSLEQIGRKALAVNLSDLAAMAAKPLATVIAFTANRTGALQTARGLYEGLLPLARQFHLAIAGGDTNTWDGPLAICVTILGIPTARGPLLRSGAQAGDWILVTGQFGGSRIEHQFTFTPRVEEALLLHEQSVLHAAIDASDGLSLDLARLTKASGVGAVVELSKIPLRPAATLWAKQQADGSTAIDHALADGEDFELILAVPPEAAAELIARQPVQCGLTCIGRFTSEPGLFKRDASGVVSPLEAHGFLHLGKP